MYLHKGFDLVSELKGVGRVLSDAPVVEEPAFIVKPLPDGSLAVEMGAGVQVRHTHDGYVIDKGHEHAIPFDADRFVSDSVQGSLNYAQNNALELAWTFDRRCGCRG